MSDDVYWILRSDNLLLTMRGDDPAQLSPCRLPADFPPPGQALRVGDWRGEPCHAADVADFPSLPGAEALSLRAIFQAGGADICRLAGRASQLLDWRRHHRHCGQCGTPTAMKDDEFAMLCPHCGLAAFPRLAPAVMVLVRHGGRLLLARSPHFKPGVFSVLAGFVEAGESLEECAAREVREEVGIEIANLRYFGSQSWPFPSSLMVGFLADYAGGSIAPDPREIEAADWYASDALPLLPSPASLARWMIDACTLQQS